MEQFLSARFQSGRNANQKIGIVGVTTGKTLEVVGRAGIGSTIFNPITDLDIRGSAHIRDNLTVNTINAQNLNVAAGAGTSLSNTIISELTVTGVSTFVGFSTFNDSVNIEDNLFVGGNARILGVTTLAQNGGITTTGGDLYVGGDLYIADDLRVDELNVRNINVSGVSTFVNGPVFIGTGTSTGTANQRLQVSGGAYIAQSVGIGTTNPRETLDVVGTIGVQASGSGNRFEIQHNAVLNSLDFIFV